METDLQPHQDKIRKVGKILWGFSLFWMIFNSLGFLIVIGSVVTFYFVGQLGEAESFAGAFTQADLVPGLEKEHLQTLLDWDYQSFLDHFWLTLFYAVAGFSVFLISMSYILKLGSCWKRSDVFGETPIRCFRILGWIYLIHGIVGQLWGMIGQFVGSSNTCDVIYFSFVRDTCFLSFLGAGTGIEWGILSLTLSWILKHAQLLREEQALVV